MAEYQAQLSEYRISNAPPTVYYIPNFVTTSEADALWQAVYSAPRQKWKQLSHRRLQNWGGIPHPKGMVAEKLPQWLEDCAGKITALGVFDDQIPNHVLVNEYTQGQGIMPHEDGPMYYPTVTTVSLGSHTLLDFYKPITDESDQADLKSRYLFSVFLEPRSLLVLKEDMYTTYLHGIAERANDIVTDAVCNLNQLGSVVDVGTPLERSTRISLTLRYVPKTVQMKRLFGK